MQMSGVYREDTRDESGSDQGSCNGHDVGSETDEFIWKDVLEEIGRFKNFDHTMKFTIEDWDSFSRSLRRYIIAKRLLDRTSIETNPEFKVDDLDYEKDCRPDLNMDAKRSSDVHVTVRSRSSNRVEQQTVETSNEEIGSSLQRIASGMLTVEVQGGSISKQEASHTNKLPGAGNECEPGDFLKI